MCVNLPGCSCVCDYILRLVCLSVRHFITYLGFVLFVVHQSVPTPTNHCGRCGDASSMTGTA